MQALRFKYKLEFFFFCLGLIKPSQKPGSFLIEFDMKLEIA